MKNYKDMADAVFRRRDEYVASVKRKKKIALNASLSLCAICLAVLGAFGIWKTGVLTPDPNVIGTKPQGYTEPTKETLHSLSGNATSEGEYSAITEHISGNTKPQGTTGSNVAPTDGGKPQTKPQATDPSEKVTKPVLRPTVPAVRPPLPLLPTLPIGPNPPIYPEVPPTSGDTSKPKPPVVLPTDPVEVPDATSATDGADVPDVPHDRPATNNPTKPNKPSPPVPNVTVPTAPATEDSDYAGSDEAPDAPSTEPCTQAPVTPEVSDPCVEPTEPTESPVVVTVPAATESLENIVEGVVVDQYGNPVKGAVVTVYCGKIAGSYTTGSNGYYFISGFSKPSSNDFGSGQYVVITSVPSGYTISGLTTNFSGSYNYIVLTCNKK